MASKTIDTLWFCNALQNFTNRKESGQLLCVYVESRFKIYETVTDDNRVFYMLTDNNNFRASLSGYRDDNKTFVNLICIVDPRFHRRGYASRLYHFVSHYNNGMSSDINLSLEAIGLWEKLKKKYPDNITMKDNRYLWT